MPSRRSSSSAARARHDPDSSTPRQATEGCVTGPGARPIARPSNLLGGLVSREVVDRNGATGEGPGPVTRPDFEPTINEVEPPGFVIDGTDSFAVPGPGDGLPPADDGSPSARARVLLTAGSVIAGLVFVVAVGSGSDAGDAQVR